MILAASEAGNVLVWIVWIFAAFACLGSGIAVVSFSNPLTRGPLLNCARTSRPKTPSASASANSAPFSFPDSRTSGLRTGSCVLAKIPCSE